MAEPDLIRTFIDRSFLGGQKWAGRAFAISRAERLLGLIEELWRHRRPVAGTTLACDIALYASRWTMTGKLPDGTAIEDGGLSVVVLRKQAYGKWQMVIDNPYGDHLMRDH